jgi:VCBS repeat-containing protein
MGLDERILIISVIFSIIIPIHAASAQVTDPTLYAVNNWEGLFYWIDFDPDNPTGLASTSSEITLNENPLTGGELFFGLAKAPDGTLYAAMILEESSTELITIDPLTADGTPVGPIEDENGSPLFIEDIAHHPNNGKIFGVTLGGQTLYEIAPSTGDTTFVCALNSAEVEGNSIAFIDTTLYRLVGTPFPSLETIDYTSPSCNRNNLFTFPTGMQIDPFDSLTNTGTGLLGINANEDIYSFSVDSVGTWSAAFVIHTGITAGGLVDASSNSSPEAINDFFDVNEDETLSIILPGILANDVNVISVDLLSVSDPSNGILIINADGSCDYIPDADFAGTDSFTYAATDGTQTSNTATVTITVNPVNDVPVVEDISVSTDLNTDVTFLITGTDVDGDVLEIQLLPPEALGGGTITDIMEVSPNSVEVTYSPNTGFVGVDTFYFTFKESLPPMVESNIGTVTIAVAQVVPPGADTLQTEKDGVADDIEAIKSPELDPKIIKKLDKALKHIYKSTSDELWQDDGVHLDDKRGTKVFNQEAKVAKQLLKLLKHVDNYDGYDYEDNTDDEGDDNDPEDVHIISMTAEFKASIQAIIDHIVDLDKRLADVSIIDANAQLSILLEDPTTPDKKLKKVQKSIDRMNKQIDKAEQKLLDEEFHKAIKHYKNAWKHAEKAIKLANK